MMPRIYIRDQNDEVLETLDEGQYFDDNMQRFLKGKATVLSFTIFKDEASYALMTAGRNLSFRYDEEDFWLSCVIVEQDETYLTVTAWSLGLELNNETHGPYKAPKAMTFEEYLAVIDIERILTIGINEVSDKKISHEWEGTESKLARLYSLATVFSAELAFDTELNEDGSLKQISLNVYREHSDADQGLGQDRRNETFYFGEDIKTIRKTEDTSDLYTAIFATGKDGLTIAGIEKEVFDEDGNLLFATYKTQKPGFGDPRKLYAPQARDQFPSNTTGGDRWTLNTAGEFEYESAEALLGYMMSELKKNCQPATTWEIEGYIKAKIGDTVRIADEGYKPTLFLEARVIEQEISFGDKTKNKSTFSNVVELESQVDSSLLDRVQKLIEANKAYQYSISTDNGIVFKNNTGVTTLTATVRDGVADVTANFEITWFKDGVSVGSGVSLTVRATDVAEKAVYRFEASKADGTVAGGYEVTVTDVNDGLPGADGEQGPQGEPGPQGADGADGLPGKDGVGVISTAITYAQSTSGTTAPTSGWTTSVPTLTKGRYLWTRTIWTYTDNSTETGYTVSYNAKDGNNGTDGIAGKDGVGITSTLVEYAKSASGTTKPTSGWSTSIPTVPAGQYLWTRTTWTYTDSTSEQGFSVAKMGDTGSKGDDGADGIGIANTKTDYQLHTSATTPPTGTWLTSPPAVTVGKYLWTRTILEYTDGTKSTPAYSVSGGPGANGSDGKDGQNGAPGADALPIFSGYVTNEAIILSATNSGAVSDFSKATGTFVTYLGQDQLTSGVTYSRVSQTGVTASINQTTGAYSVTAASADSGMVVFKAVYQGVELQKIVSVTKAKQGNIGATGPKGTDGKDGANGAKGDPGANGVSSYLHTAWKMADGTFSTVYPAENLLPDSDATSLTKVNAPYNRYFSDGSAVGVTSVGFIQISDSKTPSGYVIEAIGDGSGNGNNNRGICWYSSGGTIKLEIGKTYTMSCYARLISGASTMRFQYGIGPYFSTRIPVDSASWKQYSWTFVAQQDSTRIYMPAGSGLSGTAQFCGFKLEEGSTATPWTPTPSEDYSLAYPKYRGEYTDTIEADSTDPTKYTWTAYLGEQGPPTGVISQNTVPSSPYVGMLWQCTGNIAGYINPATYRWNGSAWTIYQFTAQNILAETFTGFVFQGVKFIGSEFISQYEVTGAGGIKTSGELTIGDGLILNQYQTGSDTSGMFKVDRNGDISNSRNEAGVSSQYELTADHLSMSSNGIGGQLTARQLMQVPWTNLPYESGFTTAENNPCQYRVVYLLDGSRELQMRGQVQNTAGTALPTATSPYIGLLPATARPVRNELVAAADSSRKGARVAVLKNGYIQIDTPNANTTYVSLGGIRILLE
ncbi:phage tail spike protein [Enterococcus asini]|uniref:phage tail spike protein n=1 Tax=Enterococcus asini TaxID=57732 RepID=UPI00266B72E3|nr:phage tail spike protein [Enterococcus asini]